MRRFSHVLVLSLSLLAGCGRKEVQTEKDLQEAFATTVGSTSAPPEVQILVDQAVTALKKDDQMTAVMSLRTVRSSGQISADQALAVEEMMIRAQRVLGDRAAQGDQQAIAALEALKMNPR